MLSYYLNFELSKPPTIKTLRKNTVNSFKIIFLVFFSTSSFAFSLKEHTEITKKAIEEFNRCVPNAFSAEHENMIVNNNLWEDINLFNKWSKYSHFYRPQETLDLYWRNDALVRVNDLNEDFSIYKVGGILHFMQDMASPLHVIPVNHGPTDGFETYAVSDVKWINVGPQLNCQQLTNPNFDSSQFPRLIDLVGLQTLRSTKNFKFQELLSEDFWQEGFFDESNNRRYFGEYGVVGNQFGFSVVIKNDREIHVPVSVYDQFKGQQLRQAIEISKLVLGILYKEQGPFDSENREEEENNIYDDFMMLN
jgi:hypothetical protein